jgi:hypothetical protein
LGSGGIAVHHEISLISTIAVGLVYGLIGGYLASRLRLPPLVGYLVAGVALGPFTPGFVADAKLAPQLAEIGVILLMFGVGMHFSIRDLLAVRNIAVPGALVQIASAVALNLRRGKFVGNEPWFQPGYGISAVGGKHRGAATRLGSARDSEVGERADRNWLADCRGSGDRNYSRAAAGVSESRRGCENGPYL